MTTAKTATPAKAGRITPKQWAEAEALWESGEVTLDDLATKFGKNKSNFARHFAKLGIVKGSKAEEHKKKIADAVTAAGIDEASVTAARIRETKDEHYKMAAGISKLVWQEILTAKTNGHAMSTVQSNLKSLDIAASALKKLREERWAILGLDRPDYVDGDEIPELVISELTAEQVLALQNRDVEDLGLEVGELADIDDLPEEEDDDIVVEGKQ